MDIGLWRDISLLLLAVPALLLALVPLAILGGMVYGLRRLHPLLPPFFARARAVMAMIHMRVEQFSAMMTAPIIATYALAARLQAWTRFGGRKAKS